MPSTRDPLTGLGDTDAFQSALARARRRTEVAVVLVDLEGLQPIERRETRAADRLLLGLAARLSSVLRTGDALFRLGDDAFAAIVALADAREADAAAQRLATAAGDIAPVTVTVGVAVPHGRESDAAVLARAVQSLN